MAGSAFQMMHAVIIFMTLIGEQSKEFPQIYLLIQNKEDEVLTSSIILWLRSYFGALDHSWIFPFCSQAHYAHNKE